MVTPPFIYADGRLDTKNTSLYLGVTVKTLAQWRYLGQGPQFIKPSGGKVFYYKDDLDGWINRFGRANSTTQSQIFSS